MLFDLVKICKLMYIICTLTHTNTRINIVIFFFDEWQYISRMFFCKFVLFWSFEIHQTLFLYHNIKIHFFVLSKKKKIVINFWILNDTSRFYTKWYRIFFNFFYVFIFNIKQIVSQLYSLKFQTSGRSNKNL